jgi:TnpA family transposase
MIDGLIPQLTDLNIQEHYSDTGGYSDLAFAVLPMFGIRYAPRIRDLNEKRLVVSTEVAQLLQAANDLLTKAERLNNEAKGTGKPTLRRQAQEICSLAVELQGQAMSLRAGVDN